jgi:spore germination cell wall hydrolase CwlJ-like protein
MKRAGPRDWVAFVVLVLLGVLVAALFGLLVAVVQGRTALAAAPREPCDLVLRAGDRPRFRINAGDLEDLSRTIFAEANNQSLCGKIAVGFVAVNRVEKDPATWGETVSAAVRKRHQFTPWTGARSRARLERLDELDAGYLEASLAASLVLTGSINDPSLGATYFHARSMVPPRWAKRMVRTVVIGGHVFYRGKS